MIPINEIAQVITTLILPEAFKEGGKTLGKAVTTLIGQLIAAIHQKLQQAGTVGLIKRVEQEPTEQHLQILESELITQMEKDNIFTEQLKEILKELQGTGFILKNPQKGNQYNFTFNDEVKGSAFGNDAKINNKWQ
jgi:hypothetical protein